MVVTSIALVALRSVLTVACTAAIGSYARWRGVLTDSGVKTLEKLVAEVFTPAIVLLKVMPNVSVDTLVAVWPNALICCFVILFGFGTGTLATRLFQKWHPDAFPALSGLVLVALAFPNSFSVPLTLFLALADHPVLRSSAAPSAASVADRGTRLFLFSYVLWIAARWSIGYPVLTGSCQSFRKWASKMLNPPTITLLIALPLGAIVGALPESSLEGLATMVAPLRAGIEYSSQSLVPATLLTLGAQLASVVESLRANRASSVELTPVASESASEVGSETARASPTLPGVAYVALIFLRQVLGPLLGGALGWGLWSSGAVRDPVVLMVAMLQSAGPPMINLAVLSGLAGGADVSRACALVLLVTYTFSIVSWTASISFFLHLLQGGDGEASYSE
jgi:predicted permease